MQLILDSVLFRGMSNKITKESRCIDQYVSIHSYIHALIVDPFCDGDVK